ncbi:MAG: hypothetical protein A3G20_04310 [Acidobacteria bacterium RIFCSPLOWO2_12_FULL_59_11]|nr:MAG: hypothetical protein A3G20_04310 [Acidobacteria bacterium RIFCSPLOWO2_12_FULL_59_11]
MSKMSTRILDDRRGLLRGLTPPATDVDWLEEELQARFLELLHDRDPGFLAWWIKTQGAIVKDIPTFRRASRNASTWRERVRRRIQAIRAPRSIARHRLGRRQTPHPLTAARQYDFLLAELRRFWVGRRCGVSADRFFAKELPRLYRVLRCGSSPQVPGRLFRDEWVAQRSPQGAAYLLLGHLHSKAPGYIRQLVFKGKPLLLLLGRTPRRFSVGRRTATIQPMTE